MSDYAQSLISGLKAAYKAYIKIYNIPFDFTGVMGVPITFMYKYNPDIDPEDCFIRMVDWVGDWNNQFNILDYFYATEENYQKALDKSGNLCYN